MANTKISALTANTNPTGNEELVYAYNNANGKMTLNTMKTFASADSQPALISGVNIKTINGDSILGSGNLVVSGGGGGGGFEPTELGGDANIWELSEGAYVTSYNLYYKSGSEIESVESPNTKRQMLFVAVDSVSGAKSYFVFNIGHISIRNYSFIYYGYSNSSSDGICNQMRRWEASLEQYGDALTETHKHPNALTNYTITQILDDIDDASTNTLRVTTGDEKPYPGMTYTIYVNSVASGQTYSISLGNGVTNPFNITLPSNSNKKCLITLLITSTTSAIVTGCTFSS